MPGPRSRRERHTRGGSGGTALCQSFPASAPDCKLGSTFVMRTTLLSLFLFMALAAPANAEEWLLPRDGLSVHASHPVGFALYLDDYDTLPYDVDVVVASDSTLTDVVARYEAEPLDGFPTIYSATPSADDPWTATPGTYYWQAGYGDEDYPVRSLIVVPAPPPDPPVPPAAVAPSVAPPPPAVPARAPDGTQARATV